MAKRNLTELPEKIIVLGKTFTIQQLDAVDESSTEQEENADGLFFLSDQLIKYREQPAIEYNQDTVLHELIHSIDEMLILNMTEHQVHSLAVGLISIIKQNPKLMKWFSRNE